MRKLIALAALVLCLFGFSSLAVADEFYDDVNECVSALNYDWPVCWNLTEQWYNGQLNYLPPDYFHHFVVSYGDVLLTSRCVMVGGGYTPDCALAGYVITTGALPMNVTPTAQMAMIWWNDGQYGPQACYYKWREPFITAYGEATGEYATQISCDYTPGPPEI